MKHPFFYNGVLYQWEIAQHNSFYGRDTLYKIYTEEESYPTARKAIVGELVEPNVPSKGVYSMKKDISLDEHIRGWYRFSYNEAEDCFELERHQGYDD